MLRAIVVGILLGFGLMWVLELTIAYPVAISRPAGWAESAGFMFLWDAVVVYGLGMFPILLITMFLANKLWPENILALGVSTAVSLWLTAWVFHPLLMGSTVLNPFVRGWYLYAADVDMALALVVFPWLLARRNRRNAGATGA